MSLREELRASLAITPKRAPRNNPLEWAERDWCSLKEAKELAARINAFWEARGWLAHAKVEMTEFWMHRRGVQAKITSSLLNGKPRFRLETKQ